MTRTNRGSRTGSGGQGSSRSPTAESVNKWKIPHYYRRSPSSASQNSNTGESNGGSTPSTPNINVMSSPKKVLLEDRKKGKKRSGYRSKRSNKKNPGEMVFVNYTVQDGNSDNESIASQNAILEELPKPLPKKKSSKSRMLKIFGNSKNDCSEEPESATPGRRSYNPLYKYAAALPCHAGGSDSDDEVVPTSQPLLPERRQHDPLAIGGFEPFVNHGQGNAKFNNDFVIPDPNFVCSKTADENDASIAFSKMFSRKRANTGGSMSSLTSLNTNLQQLQQHHYQPQQLRHSRSYSNLGNGTVPATQRNVSLSVSPFSNKFSPVRTASPARPRSARGSSGLRLSRDMSSFQDVSELLTPGIAAQEVFLDSQSGIKGKPMVGNKYKRKQDSMTELHRIYTPSKATSNASATPSSSLVTPPTFPAGYTAASSASSTPNALELSQINNSTSNSTMNHTNSATNLEPCTSHNIPSTMFYKDNSAEILLEDSDMPTPIENYPALKGIPRTTLEEKEEDEEEVSRATGGLVAVNERLRVPANNSEHLEYTNVAHGSSASSSQVDSIMTSTLSATTANSLMGAHYMQDQLASSLITKDFKNDLHGKINARATSALHQGKMDQQNICAVGLRPTDGEMPDPLFKMNLEFDFENPNSFFREEPRMNIPTNSEPNVNANAKFNFNERHGDAQKLNYDGRASTTTTIPPGGSTTFQAEDMGASVSIPHDLFDRPENGNVASKNPNNFPFCSNGGINDFSYF